MATAQEVWPDLVNTIENRSDDYVELHEYWTGNQDLPVSAAEFQSRFGSFFAGFRDNLTRPIVEVAEARIRVTQFGDGDVGEKAWQVWEDNNMPVESRWIHTDAMVKGEAFVIVLPREDGSPGIWPQVSDQCAVLYSDIDPRKAVAAMKYWVEDFERSPEKTANFVRVNLYFEDRIERWISNSSSNSLTNVISRFKPYDDPEAGSVSTHPVGEVPMYEFRANYDNTSQRGRSDLADALPLIDSINKTFLDMLVASEYTAAPQRWATGVEIPLDPQTGEPMQSYQSGADRLWTAPNEQARFGQFAAGQLGAYSDAVEMLVDHLAFISRTPQYALFRMANYPSGESLKTVETPLRSRVTDHQTEFGSAWGRVMAAALSLDTETDAGDVAPKWLPANHPWTTKEFLEELKVKVETLGVPQEQAWAEAGYTPEEIANMLDMREDEAELEFNAAEQAVQGLLESGEPPAEGPPGGLAPEQ